MRPLYLCPPSAPQTLDGCADETRAADLRRAQPPHNEKSSNVSRFCGSATPRARYQSAFAQRFNYVPSPPMPFEVSRQHRVGNATEQFWACRQVRVLMPIREAILEHLQFTRRNGEGKSVCFGWGFGLASWHREQLELLRSVSQRDTVRDCERTSCD